MGNFDSTPVLLKWPFGCFTQPACHAIGLSRPVTWAPTVAYHGKWSRKEMVKAHKKKKKKKIKTCFLDKTLPYKGPSFRLVITIHQCHWNAVTLERIDPIIPIQILHFSFKLERFYDHKDNEPKTITFYLISRILKILHLSILTKNNKLLNWVYELFSKIQRESRHDFTCDWFKDSLVERHWKTKPTIEWERCPPTWILKSRTHDHACLDVIKRVYTNSSHKFSYLQSCEAF